MMKKLYVAPEAEILQIIVENRLLTGSGSTETLTVDTAEWD